MSAVTGNSLSPSQSPKSSSSSDGVDSNTQKTALSIRTEEYHRYKKLWDEFIFLNDRCTTLDLDAKKIDRKLSFIEFPTNPLSNYADKISLFGSRWIELWTATTDLQVGASNLAATASSKEIRKDTNVFLPFVKEMIEQLCSYDKIFRHCTALLSEEKLHEASKMTLEERNNSPLFNPSLLNSCAASSSEASSEIKSKPHSSSLNPQEIDVIFQSISPEIYLESNQTQQSDDIDLWKLFFYDTVLSLADRVKQLSPEALPQQPDSPSEIIIIDNSEGLFAAKSDPSKNIIYWNKSYFEKFPASLYTQVFWLNFERLNIRSAPRIKELVDLALNQNITKEDFVEAIERLEFDNAYQSEKMLVKAFEQGAFPPDERRTSMVFADFETHYKYQQLMGHSEVIGNSYDTICPSEISFQFKGTFPVNLKSLTRQQKSEIQRIFILKKNLILSGVEGISSQFALGSIIANLRLSKTPDPLQVKVVNDIFSKSELDSLRNVRNVLCHYTPESTIKLLSGQKE